MKLPLWPLKLALRSIPDNVHSQLLSHSFNHLLKGQSIHSRLEYLQGKRLWLSLTDTGNSWRFLIQDGRFLTDQSDAPPEIHISGELNHFLQLAMRNEDPDTLFFARQLSMEGNTEDGLYLKNMLDALEFDSEAHFKAFIGEAMGVRLAAQLRRIQFGQHLRSLLVQ